MSELVNKLKEHLNSISQEEFEKEWAEIEKLGLKGPNIEQYVNYPPTQSDGMGFKPEYECKEQNISAKNTLLYKGY